MERRCYICDRVIEKQALIVSIDTAKVVDGYIENISPIMRNWELCSNCSSELRKMFSISGNYED